MTTREFYDTVAAACERMHPAVIANTVETGGGCLAVRVSAVGNEPKHVLATDEPTDGPWLIMFYDGEGDQDESTLTELDDVTDVPEHAVTMLAMFGGMQGV